MNSTYRSTITPLPFINNLWRHILQRPCERLSRGAEPGQSFARSEIRDLYHTAVSVYENVVAFYVAMDDFLVVQVF